MVLISVEGKLPGCYLPQVIGLYDTYKVIIRYI